jgi:hypothetical protein
MAGQIEKFKKVFEDEAGMDFDTFFIKNEGGAYRVIAEGIKNGEKKKINGLFCARSTEAKYLIKYAPDKNI